MKPLIIIGTGGHSHVIRDLIEQNQHELKGYINPNLKIGHSIQDKPVIANSIENLPNKQRYAYAIAIGDPHQRTAYYHLLKSHNLTTPNLTHPKATIAKETEMGDANHILAGAIINAHTTIASNTIINTGATIEHDNIILSNTHIAPQATLGGNVLVGKNTLIGLNATVLNGIVIGDNCIIAAGATVTENIPNNTMYAGTPATLKKRLNL